MLTGDEIVVIATGLNGTSMNPKTGPMVQTWILRTDMGPMDAARKNKDDAVCGDCLLRGDGGYDRACYVTLWLGPLNVFRQIGTYPAVTGTAASALLAGKDVRLGAYGDPAAVPFEVWSNILTRASGWTGYTHQWRTCDRRFQSILMASVDSVAETDEATARGWRTFRVRGNAEPLRHDEVICPASDEAGHKTTCHRCELCRGTSNPAKSVAILAHGGRKASFFRNRDAAERRTLVLA